MDDKITNIRLAGLGGMGVLKAALVLSEILFELGYDVKKAEVHGMGRLDFQRHTLRQKGI